MHFALLPKPHRLGLIILFSLLVLIGLSRIYSDDKQVALEQNIETLITSAHLINAKDTVKIAQPPVATFTENLQPNALPLEAPTTISDANTVIPSNITVASKIEQHLTPLKETATQTPPPIGNTTTIIQKVKSGDTLAGVFQRASVPSKYMYHLLHNHEKAKVLARIFPGHKLKFVLDEDKILIALHHIKSALTEAIFTRTGPNYEFTSIVREPEIRLVRTEGVIRHSLYSAAKEGTFVSVPARIQIPENINEQFIVELYSK